MEAAAIIHVEDDGGLGQGGSSEGGMKCVVFEYILKREMRGFVNGSFLL